MEQIIYTYYRFNENVYKWNKITKTYYFHNAVYIKTIQF